MQKPSASRRCLWHCHGCTAVCIERQDWGEQTLEFQCSSWCYIESCELSIQGIQFGTRCQTRSISVTCCGGWETRTIPRWASESNLAGADGSYRQNECKSNEERSFFFIPSTINQTTTQRKNSRQCRGHHRRLTTTHAVIARQMAQNSSHPALWYYNDG
jgi:hypothetical protein